MSPIKVLKRCGSSPAMTHLALLCDAKQSWAETDCDTLARALWLPSWTLRYDPVLFFCVWVSFLVEMSEIVLLQTNPTLFAVMYISIYRSLLITWLPWKNAATDDDDIFLLLFLLTYLWALMYVWQMGVWSSCHFVCTAKACHVKHTGFLIMLGRLAHAVPRIAGQFVM